MKNRAVFLFSVLVYLSPALAFSGNDRFDSKRTYVKSRREEILELNKTVSLLVPISLSGLPDHELERLRQQHQALKSATAKRLKAQDQLTQVYPDESTRKHSDAEMKQNRLNKLEHRAHVSAGNQQNYEPVFESTLQRISERRAWLEKEHNTLVRGGNHARLVDSMNQTLYRLAQFETVLSQLNKSDVFHPGQMRAVQANGLADAQKPANGLPLTQEAEQEEKSAESAVQ